VKSEREARVVLVTGAAGGIGGAVARSRVQAGDVVLGVDINRNGLQLVASDVLGSRGTFHPQVVDITSDEGVYDLAGLVRREFGRLDSLVNAAGVISRHTIHDLDIAEWDRIVGINLRAPFVLTKACLGLMPRGSVIINVTSIQSEVANGDLPHYAASKGGLKQLTKSLAVSLAPDQIRVVAVAPGSTDTGMNAADRADPAVQAAYLARIPLGRLVEPAEIAEVISFLLSAGGRSITGTTVVVDGGKLATR
jgi:glucose 1-dehydrogenase